MGEGFYNAIAEKWEEWQGMGVIFCHRPQKSRVEDGKSGEKKAGKRFPADSASGRVYSSHSARGKAISKQAPPSSQVVARIFPP
jgi:hypothetical protein